MGNICHQSVPENHSMYKIIGEGASCPRPDAEKCDSSSSSDIGEMQFIPAASKFLKVIFILF